jgi:hypothetical protein
MAASNTSIRTGIRPVRNNDLALNMIDPPSPVQLYGTGSNFRIGAFGKVCIYPVCLLLD